MGFTDTQKEELYRTYHGKIYGYIQSRVNHAQTAEDMTSEIFLKVYEKLDSFDAKKASLSTWIYTIARNTLTDYYRTRRVFSEVSEALPDDSSVEEEACNNETLENLADALSVLDERERDIIILRFYSGKTLKEIAMQMGISYAYVKVLQNKALEQMRTKISS